MRRYVLCGTPKIKSNAFFFIMISCPGLSTVLGNRITFAAQTFSINIIIDQPSNFHRYLNERANERTNE